MDSFPSDYISPPHRLPRWVRTKKPKLNSGALEAIAANDQIARQKRYALRIFEFACIVLLDSGTSIYVMGRGYVNRALREWNFSGLYPILQDLKVT